MDDKDLKDLQKKENTKQVLKDAGSVAISVGTSGAVPAGVASRAIDSAEKIPVVNKAVDNVGDIVSKTPIGEVADKSASNPQYNLARDAAFKATGGTGSQNFVNPKSSPQNNNVSQALQKNADSRKYQKPVRQNQEITEENKNETKQEETDDENQTTNVETENKIKTSYSEELGKKIKKKAMSLLLSAAPAFMFIIMFIIILSIFIYPVVWLNQNFDKLKAGASEFFDKTLNFYTFNGWKTSAEVFTSKLYDGDDSEVSRYNKLIHEGDYDVPLITATIFSLRTSNPEYAFDDTSNLEEGGYEGDYVVSSNENDKAFYRWATAWLGSFEKPIQITIPITPVGALYSSLDSFNINIVDSLGLGLSGNLVNYYMGYDCIEYVDALGYLSYISQLFRSVLGIDVFTGLDAIKDIVEYITYKTAFNDMGVSYGDAIILNKKFADNGKNAWQRLYNISQNPRSKGGSGFYGGTCSSGKVKLPTLNAYIDYENYEEYLKEVYIPATYILCDKCAYNLRYAEYLKNNKSDKEETVFFNRKIQEIYDNIINLKKTYENVYSSSSNISYNVALDTKKYNNIKVSIADNKNNNIETLTIDEYIQGVTYNYVISKNITNKEVIKAIIVAIRSKVAFQSLNNEITLTNSGDPIYCDVKQGCYYDSYKKTYVSGQSAGSNLYPPASSNILNLINSCMKDVEDVVALDKQYNVTSINIKDKLVDKFIELGNDSKNDYNQIIISSTGVNTLSGHYNNGDYIYWSQLDPQWKNQLINPGYGSETIGQVGCVITSVAILMAKSGTKLTVTPFNPSIFAQYMANYKSGGYYADCGDGQKVCFYWNAPSATNIAPNFKFVDFVGLNGSKENKINKIKEYYNKGYYISIRLKDNRHSVALDHVEGNTVYIIDPAISTKAGVVELTNNIKGYKWSGVYGMHIYKKED